MFQDYAELEVGTRVSSKEYDLEPELVSDYVDAVQHENGLLKDNDGREMVPPMAVAALSIRGAVEDLRIPGGTLHAGQEIRFSRAVAVGTRLSCVATLTQNSTRGDWRFLVVDCSVTDDDSEVMTGKSTIMIPAGQGPSEAQG
jgi:hypothetical protein